MGTSVMLHKCDRDSKCNCIRLGTFLLSVMHQRGDTEDLEQKLSKLYFFEPTTRLPFKLISTWIQLEIHEGHFSEAEELLKTYICKSTKLSDPPKQ